jgi:hypothetical protein
VPTSSGTRHAEALRSVQGDDERRLNRRGVSALVICGGVLADAVHLGTLPMGIPAQRRFATQGTDCVAIRWSAVSVGKRSASAWYCPPRSAKGAAHWPHLSQRRQAKAFGMGRQRLLERGGTAERGSG